MQFSGKQLAAIFRLGKQMVLADGIVKEEEMQVLSNELMRFGVPPHQLSGLMAVADSLDTADLLATVASMDDEQKKYVCAYLGTILAIDGDIDDAEMKLWGLTSALCGLPTMNIAEAIEYMSNL